MSRKISAREKIAALPNQRNGQFRITYREMAHKPPSAKNMLSVHKAGYKSG